MQRNLVLLMARLGTLLAKLNYVDSYSGWRQRAEPGGGGGGGCRVGYALYVVHSNCVVYCMDFSRFWLEVNSKFRSDMPADLVTIGNCESWLILGIPKVPHKIKVLALDIRILG